MSKKRHFSRSLSDINRRFLPSDQHYTRPFNVGFVLPEHFSVATFTAAVDALVTANLVSSKPSFRYTTYGLDSTNVLCDLGFDISANHLIDQLLQEESEQLDILIVCGGYRCALQEVPLLSRKLKQASQQGVILGSLWNGAIALAHAGLLNQRPCAVHPDNHAFIREHFPAVELSKHALIIEPELATSAGASSALEMMLRLIEQLCGKTLARAVREILSCDQMGVEFSDHPLRINEDPSLPQNLRDLLNLMRNNIEEPLSLDELASLGNISRRQVERLFQSHMQTTPSRYYLELRITRARRLLLQSNLSITDISVACGFVSSTHFSHCFKDFFGLTPGQARQRHRQ